MVGALSGWFPSSRPAGSSSRKRRHLSRIDESCRPAPPRARIPPVQTRSCSAKDPIRGRQCRFQCDLGKQRRTTRLPVPHSSDGNVRAESSSPNCSRSRNITPSRLRSQSAGTQAPALSIPSPFAESRRTPDSSSDRDSTFRANILRLRRLRCPSENS